MRSPALPTHPRGAAPRRAAAALLAALAAIPLAGQSNPIPAENQLTGSTGWIIPDNVTSDDGVANAHNGAIKGFASETSVNAGGVISFFVSAYTPGKTQHIPYTIDIYRMGYYQGRGGRLHKTIRFQHNAASPACTVQSTAPLTEACGWGGYVQPYCRIVDAATGLAECPWHRTYDLAVPAAWVSGVYLAKLTNNDTGHQSYIGFVVRRDAAYADFVYQQPVNTYQAYNNYPATTAGAASAAFSKSLYPNSWGGSQAYKVSFHRPYAAWSKGGGYFLSWEYYFVKWAEKQGYNIKYTTSVDTHRSGAVIPRSLAFLSAGHDEYWTREMYDNVRSARDGPGTSLAFFGGNNIYYKSRYEASPTTGVPLRVLVSYKELAAQDPHAADVSLSTGLFRQKYVPEEQLLGLRFAGTHSNGATSVQDYLVAGGGHWFWYCAGVVNGSRIKGINGYEVDQVGVSLPTSTTEFTLLGSSPYVALINGRDSTVTSNSVLYLHTSSSWVFDAGTISWSWALADATEPLRPRGQPEPAASNWPAVRRATRNLLDMMRNAALAPCGAVF